MRKTVGQGGEVTWSKKIWDKEKGKKGVKLWDLTPY